MQRLDLSNKSTSQSQSQERRAQTSAKSKKNTTAKVRAVKRTNNPIKRINKHAKRTKSSFCQIEAEKGESLTCSQAQIN
jgi:uncharacterized protein YpmB